MTDQPTASPNSSAPSKDFTFETFLEELEAPTISVTIQTNGKLALKLEKLLEEIANARLARRDDQDASLATPDHTSALNQQYAELVESGKATEREFEFTSIGPHAYEKLLRECTLPPNDPRRKSGIDHYDPDKLIPRLIAAASYKPKLTDEQVAELYNTRKLSHGQIMRMFNAAQQVNQEVIDLPFTSAGIAKMLASASRQTTATNAESL